MGMWYGVEKISHKALTDMEQDDDDECPVIFLSEINPEEANSKLHSEYNYSQQYGSGYGTGYKGEKSNFKMLLLHIFYY